MENVYNLGAWEFEIISEEVLASPEWKGRLRLL